MVGRVKMKKELKLFEFLFYSPNIILIFISKHYHEFIESECTSLNHYGYPVG